MEIHLEILSQGDKGQLKSALHESSKRLPKLLLCLWQKMTSAEGLRNVQDEMGRERNSGGGTCALFLPDLRAIIAGAEKGNCLLTASGRCGAYK
jgi:hypothetical protein